MIPSTTFQWARIFSSASACFFAKSSGGSLTRKAGIERGFFPFLSAGSGTINNPCQLARSLPLNSAVKPGGGMLSFGPAFSPASIVVIAARSVRPISVAYQIRIVLVLSNVVSGFALYPAMDAGEKQAENGQTWRARLRV